MHLGHKKRVEMDHIKATAASLTQSLKERADQMAKAAQHRQTRATSTAHKSLGDKTDYLVSKFVTILKNKV